jgi:hypothetical protein
MREITTMQVNCLYIIVVINNINNYKTNKLIVIGLTNKIVEITRFGFDQI